MFVPQTQESQTYDQQESQESSLILIDPFLDIPLSDTPSQLRSAFMDSSVAFLFSPTPMSTTPTLPPHVFFKHTPSNAPDMCITNAPPLSLESNLQALVAENEGLQMELSMARSKNKELEAEIESTTDGANAQMLFMGCALDQSLEQLAQKEKKKSKKGFWL